MIKKCIFKRLAAMCCALSCMSIAAMAQQGAPDPSFVTGTGFSDGSSVGWVQHLLLQDNGKMVAVGSFTEYNGTASKNIIRLNASGTVDASYNVGSGFDELVESAVIQNDGKVVAGGWFVAYNGTPASGIARVNTDGSPDGTFQYGTGFTAGKGAGGATAMALQKDGKIIAGGIFSAYNGNPVENIVRIKPDGTIDAAFTASLDDMPTKIAVQNDGKIIVAGWFSQVNGVSRSGIARLNTDGTLDAGFNTGSGFNGDIYGVMVQPDDKILIGGSFSSYNGTTYGKIVRLMPDGTVDTSFKTGMGFSSEYVARFALQPDGKILAGGNFTSYNGDAARSLVRMHENGAMDTSFKTGAGFANGTNSNGQLWSLVPQPDGKILVGGIFTKYDGADHKCIIRLDGFEAPMKITDLLPGTDYCPGTKVAVHFRAGMTGLNAGNVFTAQLSDANGSFANPTVLGTLAGTSDGVITGTIPSGISGTAFRIRIVSSDPAHIGPDNGTDITISSGANIPAITASSSKNELCAGEQVSLTATAGSAVITWNDNVVDGQPFTPNQTKIYTAVATANGCSNSEQVEIVVHDLPEVVGIASEDTVCKGTEVVFSGSGAVSYTWDHNVQDGVPYETESTAVFTVTGTDANNCTNTDQVTVTVLQPGTLTIDATICVGDTYQLGTQSLSAAGAYTETFTGAAANGCDSIVTLNLSVAPDDISVSRDGQTLTAGASNATWQWINCTDNSAITGANNQSFTPNLPGVFAVVITQNGCSDTSECVSVWPAGISMDEAGSAFVLYPNPVRDLLTIKGDNITGISASDITGKVLYSVTTTPATVHTIPTGAWHEGIYIIRITTGEMHQVYKIRKINGTF